MGIPKLPDPYPNAIRIALAVFTATAIGYGIVLPEHGIHTTYARQFSQASKWAAITCVVVNAPVIGKVAQTGAERILGTLAGGTLGYLVYEVGHRLWDPNTRTDGITLSIAAALVAFSGIVLGKKLNLAYSAKLYSIAFLIVTFGAVDEQSTDTSVFLLAAMRVTGIASGVLLSELYAVLIFPKSATQEAVAKMKAAMQKLAGLNQLVWDQAPLTRPDKSAQKRADGYMVLAGKEETLEELLTRQEKFEAESEKALMDVYDALYKVEEQVPLAAAEIYLFTWRGTLIFLPGLPWLPMGRWHLPEKEMDALATSLRKVARLLWALHLSFLDGFDENMLSMLKQQYPSQLMPQLAQHSQGALEAAAAAFPGKRRVDESNLQLFVTAVEGLMRISDFQRRRILQLIKHFRAAGTARRTLARAFSARQHSQTATRASLDAFSPPSRTAASMPEPSALPQSSQEMDLEQGLSPGKKVDLGPYSRAQPTDLPAVPERRRAEETANGDVMDRSNTEEMMLGSVEDNQEGLAQRGRQSSTLTEALATAEAMPQPPASNAAQQRRPTSMRDLDWTLNRSYVGTPNEALGHLPEGLHIAMDDAAAASGRGTPDLVEQMAGVKGPECQRLLTMRLKRVQSSELIEFPENEEGYLGKIRWYSFQFLMQELAEELEDMHEAMDNVLAILNVAMGE